MAQISFAVTAQRLCFLYINSAIALLPKSEISSLWPYSVADSLVSVGHGRARFSCDTAHLECLL